MTPSPRAEAAPADVACASWVELWGSDAAWSRCAPEVIHSPFDLVALLQGEESRAHWARRRRRSRLIEAELAPLAVWSAGEARIVIGELDFTLESGDGRERRRLNAGFVLDAGGRALIVAEAAPAVMVLIHQAYMAEAADA